MSKKTMKIVSVITIILSIVMMGTMVFADELTPDSINGKANTVNVTKIGTIGNSIATIIRNVGIVAAVVIIMILGLKYMMGSAQEKAEYKKTMIPYIVGAVLLFGASAIAQMVINFAGSVA